MPYAISLVTLEKEYWTRNIVRVDVLNRILQDTQDHINEELLLYKGGA